MTQIKTAVLIGAGNVATHMGKALINKGIQVVQVYSPSASAQKLARRLKSTYTHSFTDIAKADIIIIAVKDDALPQVAAQLRVSNTLVVHTSGGVEAAVLSQCSKHYGVFYPFQTFNKSLKLNFAKVPLCIEANSSAQLKRLEKLAGMLVDKHYIINSSQRQWLHIMGVFTSNFTNLMFRAAKDIADEQSIPFDIVFPLIDQTVAKIKYNNPADVQTGPAFRKDNELIKKHIAKLNDLSVYKAIYMQLTKAIQELNNTHGFVDKANRNS